MNYIPLIILLVLDAVSVGIALAMDGDTRVIKFGNTFIASVVQWILIYLAVRP